MAAIESTAYRDLQAKLSKTDHWRKGNFRPMAVMIDKERGERIKFIRNLRDMTQEEFAEFLGVKRGALGNWELGKAISGDNIFRIARVCVVDPAWIAFGTGHEPVDDDIPHLASEDVLRDDAPTDELPGAVSTVKPYTPKLPNGSPVVATHLSAGGGATPQTAVTESNGILYSADAIIGEIVLPPQISNSLTMAPSSRVHWFEVRGDSMEPTLRGGDWVGINTMDTGTRAGGIFALRTGNGEVIVKRVNDRGDGQRIEIVSDNPSQENYFENAQHIVVFGRVVARLSRVG